MQSQLTATIVQCESVLKPLVVLQVAFIGFVVQALVTRSNGPIDDLTSHLSNPFGNNIITNIANLPQTLTRH